MQNTYVILIYIITSLVGRSYGGDTANIEVHKTTVGNLDIKATPVMTMITATADSIKFIVDPGTEKVEVPDKKDTLTNRDVQPSNFSLFIPPAGVAQNNSTTFATNETSLINSTVHTGFLSNVSLGNTTLGNNVQNISLFNSTLSNQVHSILNETHGNDTLATAKKELIDVANSSILNSTIDSKINASANLVNSSTDAFNRNNTSSIQNDTLAHIHNTATISSATPSSLHNNTASSLQNSTTGNVYNATTGNVYNATTGNVYNATIGNLYNATTGNLYNATTGNLYNASTISNFSTNLLQNNTLSNLHNGTANGSTNAYQNSTVTGHKRTLKTRSLMKQLKLKTPATKIKTIPGAKKSSKKSTVGEEQHVRGSAGSLMINTNLNQTFAIDSEGGSLDIEVKNRSEAARKKNGIFKGFKKVHIIEDVSGLKKSKLLPHPKRIKKV